MRILNSWVFIGLKYWKVSLIECKLNLLIECMCVGWDKFILDMGLKMINVVYFFDF